MARVLGPLVAAAAITAVGFGFAFGLNSLTFVALIVALLFIRPRQIAIDPGSKGTQGTIREGMAYVWNERRIRLMLLGVLVGAAAFDPVFTLAPVFASRLYGLHAAAGGLLMASFGLGAIIAGAVSSRYFRGTTGLRWVRSFMLLFAAGLVALVFSPVYWAACAAAFVAGIGSLLSMIAWTTGIQHEVPERLRGRVMAMWTLAFLGMRVFAGPISGLMASSFGPRSAVALLGIPLVLVACFGVGRLKKYPAPAPASA
jgi:MFS family permease